MPYAMTVHGLDALIKKLKEAKSGLNKEVRPMFETVARTAARSIALNFSAGGRPETWIPSQRVLRHGGTTMVNTGKLLSNVQADKIIRSITTGAYLNAQTHVLTLAPAPIGYGPNLHTGVTGAYPARPWFMLQQEDVAKIGLFFNDSIRRGIFGPLLT